MNKRKIVYLVNPISGTGNQLSLKDVIAAKTKSAGFDFSIYPSLESGDYSFLYPIIKEEGITDVVVAGGDGTINQAVNSLREQNVQFGIIPCGSGNGLAFSAGIPKNTEKALQVIFKGNSQWTDAFLINDTFACMLCGLGLDAQVAHDFANDPKRGLTTYIRKTIADFFSAKTYPFVLTARGKKMKVEAFFISVANSNQFGNHFTIAPKASLTDGMLDIVVMTKQNKLSVLLQTIKQVGGYNKLQELEVVDEKAAVIYFQTDSLRIINPHAAPLHIDGDPVESADVFNIRLLKHCFRLIYP
jgi:diacylglycerol kinase (ATP)